MESHYFTEPIPVEPEGKDAALPTWRVEVIRHSTTDSVGTLLISNDNLPPRKNKKKILWKLPDNTSSNPTFGEHEKKRLWELFKQQKKDRKKQALLEKVQGDEENTIEANGEKPVLIFSNGAAATAPTSGENGCDEKLSTTSTNTRRSPVTVTTHSTPVQSGGDRSPPVNSVRPPPPPPGFDMAARLRAQPPPAPGLSAMTTTTVLPSTTNAAVELPPGLSATTTAMQSTTPGTLAQPPAPAPGLPVTTTTAMPSNTRAALFHAATNKTVPTVASTSRYPTGVTSSLLPLPQQREQQQNQQQQQPSFFGPPRYFRRSLNEPATALAQQVVACFLNTMTCATPGVSSTTWLQYYSAETPVTKTLLIGSAQAVCRTPQDCLQQVRSLSMPGESIWECHGYTIQPTCTSTTTAKRFSNVTGANANANADQSHLIIMTGRTIQKGESLAYNLTLVLKPTEQVSPAGIAAATNAADSDGAVYYQIQNDVLSLFAVNVTATAESATA
jgi:hypothetical protein